MNILISNDDGIESNGIIELAKHLSKNNNVLVVAPNSNRSAVSHSMTINKNIKVKNYKSECFEAYSIDGTPVDCVKFAVLYLKFKPDVVVAGINKAHNIGSDIMYSGTVAICSEASYLGFKSFAFSAFSHGESNFKLYSVYAEKIITSLYPYTNCGDIWNVNFPKESLDIKGVRIVRTGIHKYTDRYVKISDNEFKIEGDPVAFTDDDIGSDVEGIQNGYVTISPLTIDRTDREKLKEVDKLWIEL